MSYHLTDNIIVYERADWGARSPSAVMTEQGAPQEAFLHHTADHTAEDINHKSEQIAAMRGIQNFHMDVLRWFDIAYHYVVFQVYGDVPHARVYEGRDHHLVPAAQLGHNTGTLAICVFGNFDHEDQVKDNTRHAITKLLTEQQSKTGAKQVKTLGGHRDVVGTECPGDALYSVIPQIAHNAGLKVYNP